MLRKRKPSRKQLTVRGVGLFMCDRVGCTNKARRHWAICADGRIMRVVCNECDIAINEMVMRFMFGDTREYDLEQYREHVQAGK